MKQQTTIKIRHYEYMNRTHIIKEVKVKKFFEWNGRKLAVCATNEQIKYCYVYDCLTGIELQPLGKYSAFPMKTIKEKIATITTFLNEYGGKANWDKFDILNPEFKN